MNDTAISTAYEPGVIVSGKGLKILGEKQMVLLCAASGSSSFVSATFIYLRQREKYVPPGEHNNCSKSVWTNRELLVGRQHFVRTD